VDVEAGVAAEPVVDHVGLVGGVVVADDVVTAREAVDKMVQAWMLDDLMNQVDDGDLQLTGDGGFLPELVRRVLEAGLQAELTDHLGYERHDRAGHGSGNSRNGYTQKRLGSEIGDLQLATPRDRLGSFEPRLVSKGQRRVGHDHLLVCRWHDNPGHSGPSGTHPWAPS
jgi:putative transposase